MHNKSRSTYWYHTQAKGKIMPVKRHLKPPSTEFLTLKVGLLSNFKAIPKLSLILNFSTVEFRFRLMNFN